MQTPNFEGLESSYKFLTNLNLGLLILGGVVALAIGIVSVLSTHKGDELIRSKDEQLKRDLKDKDLQIAALHKAARPRILDSRAFLAVLKGKPKARIEILYKSDDDEAYSLAGQINRWLGTGAENDGAGWEVTEPRPLTEADVLGGKWSKPKAPLATNAGAWFGLGLVVKEAPYPPFGNGNENTPIWALSFALQNAGVGGGQVTTNPQFPDGLIRIVVGPKMY